MDGYSADHGLVLQELDRSSRQAAINLRKGDAMSKTMFWPDITLFMLLHAQTKSAARSSCLGAQLSVTNSMSVSTNQ
jgi:hypothetical protein